MKRPELLKRMLAGTLVLALAAADAAPVMAAEVQQPMPAIEAETKEPETPGDLLKEAQEEKSAEPKAEKAEAEEPEEATSEESEENRETEPEKQTEAELSETESKEQPEAAEDAAEESRDLQNDAKAAAAPVINKPVISARDEGSYTIFNLTFTGTDFESTDLSVKASNSGSVVYTRSSYDSGDSIDTDYFYDSKTGKYDLYPGVTYTFTLTPYTYVYVEDEYGYEDEEIVYGAPVSVTWKAPSVVSVSGLSLKEMTSSGFQFSHKALPEGTNVYYEYSTNKSFNESAADVNYTSSAYLSYSSLTPGLTYYVRAYATRYGVKGKYSNVVTVKAPVAEVTSISTEVFDKAITLEMYAGFGNYTGFQIERKSGKGKYKALTTTTDHCFKDSGLKKNTKYTYRVRAYYYNVNTKKTVYGDYSYNIVQTGAAAMDLRAKAAGKDSIKLTWKKISDAAGYDVYRYVTSSASNTVQSGAQFGFSKYELIKSLGKKSASYTDKKLLEGEFYSYRVKAYKMVKGKKKYFTEDSASAELKFSLDTSVNIYKQAQNPKNGKVTIAWYPISHAKGYLIEKYDDNKGDWVTQKKITKVKTVSYTLPASPLGKTVRYRVRAFSGKKYSRAGEVSVTGYLAAVTGVKAKSTKNGISISWKKVPGASYYRVYRTLDSGATYYADTKTYSYSGGSSVSIQVFKQASITDNYYYTLGSSKTKMEKDYEAAQKLAYASPYSDYIDTSRIKGTSVTDYSSAYHSPVYNDKGVATREDVTLYGPQSDVTYHYYVVAYKEQRDSKDSSYYTVNSYGASKSASASMSGTASKAPAIQKVKAGKGSATITVKKVKGAKKYLIYRSTSKKKGFKLVASTTKAVYKDKKLSAKKTYYYKVKVLSQNSLGADKYSSFSKVKSVKTK